ncbi:hypothetical protein [Sinorhizobium psoraleae]|uniref:Uncharacterized protein n=1 Tax=Sinorhizobium psoraleae TaxID=520838 RepID=A0ABT4KNA9_9HYPH|nr:hypothetical protein [Sinorhizobium psoraleae]MCZ4093389.1 hypothetical protein [Sinorhizobium psoraleae]
MPSDFTSLPSSAETAVAWIHKRDIVAARFVLLKRIHAQADKTVYCRNQAVPRAKIRPTKDVDLGQVELRTDKDLQMKAEPVVELATAIGGGQS